MRQLTRGVLLVAFGGLATSFCGCTKGYNFEVMGTVRSAVDGRPIPGVSLTVNDYGQKDRPDLDRAATRTDDAGAFTTQTFFVSMDAFNEGRPTWYLKVEKEGYLPECVEIKPKRAPEQLGSTSTIVPLVYLRPAK